LRKRILFHEIAFILKPRNGWGETGSETETCQSSAQAPKKRAESQSSGATPENENGLFPQRNRAKESILRIGRPISRTKQWRQALIVVPWYALDSGPDDPSIGGGRLGAMTPFRKR